MFGKLLKYDVRSCLRRFWPLWVGLIALAAINGFTVQHVLEGRTVHGIVRFFLGYLPLILFFSLCMVTAVLILVHVCQRFSRGLLGNEGYLMFTLPTTPAALVGSKCAAAMVLEILSALAVGIAMALFLVIMDAKAMRDLFKEALEALKVVDIPKGAGWLAAEFVLASLIGQILFVLHLYASMALGHLAKAHRNALAVAAFIGLSILGSLLMNLLFDTGIARTLYEHTIEAFDISGNLWYLAAGIGLVLLAEILAGAVLYIGTTLILKHRLNLE